MENIFKSLCPVQDLRFMFQIKSPLAFDRIPSSLNTRFVFWNISEWKDCVVENKVTYFYSSTILVSMETICLFPLWYLLTNTSTIKNVAGVDIAVYGKNTEEV